MFETLGQYKILDRIGAGSMGDVYRARDTRSRPHGRDQGASAGDRRRRRAARAVPAEARTAASLSHPNIAALYEVGEDQDQLFLVFEFVPGETLKNTIAGRPLNPRRAVDLGVQIADALADAHAAGLVHRDLGCNNIIVTPKGNAKMLDFGLATWTRRGDRDRWHVTDARADGTCRPTRRWSTSPDRHLLARRRDVRNADRQAAVRRATSTALALQSCRRRRRCPRR